MSNAFEGRVPLLRETARTATMLCMVDAPQIDVPKLRRAILAWLDANPKESRRSLSMKASGGGNADMVRDTFRVDKRVPKFETVAALAKAMGVEVSEFVRSLPPRSRSDGDSWLRIYGAVEAGAWHEYREWPAEDQYEVEVPIEGEFPGETGLVVRGRSMEKRLPPGTYLRCVPLIGSGHDFQDNDYVIVERMKAGLRELTCKRISLRPDGNWELVAESYAPEFADPIFIGKPIEEGDAMRFDGLNEDETRVTALVIDAFLPLARRRIRPIAD